MLLSFKEMIREVQTKKCFRLSVAAADDIELLKAVKMAVDMGIVFPILVGQKETVQKAAEAAGLQEYEIIHSVSPEESAALAVEMVKEGKADVLMKGAINTSHYMRAILDRENGIRGDGLLSAFAAYEIKEYHKLIFCSDSGINVAPDVEQKKDILRNSLQALHTLGFATPKVAVLTSNEIVHPKVQATVDADILSKLASKGAFGSCIVEGPISFDVAFDPEAAKHKGVDSAITGDVDLILSPNIETGNVLGKSWLTLGKAKWAGLVLGTQHPVILGSRSDSAEVKINSIALACLMASS